MALQLDQIDKTWTLFLDRDGVINHESENGEYVTNLQEFRFYDKAPEDIALLSHAFGYLFIATNQRGVARGFFTEPDLIGIHDNMLSGITKAGGHIEKIYYCLAKEISDPCRKPNPGMAYLAKKDYPDIDFSKAIMVGNNISDMEFGRNAGMHTVFVKTTSPYLPVPHPSIDLVFSDLHGFAEALRKS